MTSTDCLLAERQTLRAECSRVRAECRRLAHEIESFETVKAGPEAIERERARLEALIRTVQATAAQWETTVRELRREVWVLNRKLETRS